MLYLITFPAIWYNVLLGKDGLLNTAILGAAALAFAGKWPGLTGGLMALLCYKPQLVLAIPACLLAGRQSRAITAFAFRVCTLVLLSLWLDGLATWCAFFAIFLPRRRHNLGHPGDNRGASGFARRRRPADTILSAYGFALTIGLGHLPVAVFQAVISTGALIVAAWIWRSSRHAEPRVLSLLAAIILAAPLFMLYDATIYVLALAWVWRACKATGWLP